MNNLEDIDDKIWNGINLDILDRMKPLIKKLRKEYFKVGEKKGFDKKEIIMAYRDFAFKTLQFEIG